MAIEMTTTIRRATSEDAETISRLANISFPETFEHLYPPEDLAEYLSTAYTVESQRRLIENPANAVWLVERDGEAIGHAVAGACSLPHPEVRPEDGELKRLYLLRPAQGGGWGTKLMNEALAWLEREGPRTLWIGVFSENLGAQRLYARHGFEKVGEYLFPVGRVRDREFILRRKAR